MTATDTTTAPTDAYELAARIGALGPDDSYEDLRALVVDAHGPEKADQLFEHAHIELGHEYAIDDAQSDLADALRTVETALTDGRRALERLTDGGDAWHVEYAEGTTGDDIRAFLDTAARSVRAATALDKQHRPPGPGRHEHAQRQFLTPDGTGLQQPGRSRHHPPTAQKLRRMSVNFTLTPEAAALTAVRIVNGKPITYTIADPKQGRPAIERALKAAHSLGHLAAPEGEPYGVLDILNAEDELVQDFVLPTEEAFAWSQHRLGLCPSPTA